MSPAARTALRRLAAEGGRAIRDERLKRRWSMRELAERAGVGLGTLHSVESSEVASLESYARIGAALGLRPTLEFADSRSRRHASGGEDVVHAAMGEFEARALARPGVRISIDEPYQHYQFAGRADVLAWDDENLLHIENRTRFPNLQEAAGSYNAKRQYLAPSMGRRLNLGPQGWRSVTHVMACLWSSEVIHAIRLRRASFDALCPDPVEAFEAWMAGNQLPQAGVTSTLVLLDPAVPPGSRRRAIVGLADLARIDPRYRSYADAADALRRGG
jgi:transcriptional regulator with XRE-family HTH domain